MLVGSWFEENRFAGRGAWFRFYGGVGIVGWKVIFDMLFFYRY